MTASPLLPKLELLNDEGRTVAPLNALSKWLCCLASCSRVSSNRILWSRSTCRAFCQRLLWLWARERKSRHALRRRRAKATSGYSVRDLPKMGALFSKFTLGCLTLIMALDVILNSVALSVTCLIFSPKSPPTRIVSSSDKDLCTQDTIID